jgi:hypothetical protein
MNDVIYKLSSCQTIYCHQRLFIAERTIWQNMTLESFVKHRLGRYFDPVEEWPPGSRDVMFTTGAMNERELDTSLETRRYFARGYQTVRAG